MFEFMMVTSKRMIRVCLRLNTSTRMILDSETTSLDYPRPTTVPPEIAPSRSTAHCA